MKKKIYVFINQNPKFIQFIYGLIILNVIAVILETYKGIITRWGEFFWFFEIFSIIIFSIEYLLRLWTADLDEKYTGGPATKRMKFAVSKLGLIDLIAILPFYLSFVFPFDLRIMRILRLFRLLRIFKLGRYSKSFKIINNVLTETRSELVITASVAFILLILSSTLMYYIENAAQPDKFASIGQAFWWSIATLTTVGYGDIYPITPLGKILSAIIALIGIGFVALPTGIISSAFVKKIQGQKSETVNRRICKCPNCGTEFEQ